MLVPMMGTNSTVETTKEMTTVHRVKKLPLPAACQNARATFATFGVTF